MEEETRRYGTNHAVIGFLLAKHWELPKHVCTAIYNSHVNLCAEFEDSEIRGLIAILKITRNTTTNLLYPGIELSDESINSLNNAYTEIAVNDDTLQEMSHKVKSGAL